MNAFLLYNYLLIHEMLYFCDIGGSPYMYVCMSVAKIIREMYIVVSTHYSYQVFFNPLRNIEVN